MNYSGPVSLASRSPSGRQAPLVCFSHLRWDFVLQRPQHLMERFSAERQVFFFEEFIPTDHHLAYLEIHPFQGTSVKAIRPRVPHWWNDQERDKALSQLLDELLSLYGVAKPVLWFYTPIMFEFARHVDAAAIVYDCMDELANFKFASPRLKQAETALIARADVVFTGGHSLYEAKCHLHANMHPFPSSVDVGHFRSARSDVIEPTDQIHLTGPKLGYYGVIDERLDLALIAQLAKARPHFSFIFVGPVVKIAPEALPKAPNIHYLGQKSYDELPAYLSAWDAAMMPFALNEATKFISPTKTPEYLAGGRPVISTAIADVRRHYGEVEGVFIAEDAQTFVAACDAAVELRTGGTSWLKSVDTMLETSSWDITFKAMQTLVSEAIHKRNEPAQTKAVRPANIRRNPPSQYDYLIVGAGLAGSVLAERLAADDGKRVLVCDRRPHIGGNAYDFFDESGVLVHKYGPHIFHTNSEEVFSYLSRFTAWRPYEHRVLAQVGDLQLPIPINRTTLNGLYGLDLRSDDEAAKFLASRAEPCQVIANSKDMVISQVGSDLYRVFFEGYTRKQWGLDPSQLDKSVTARVPTRTSTDDRYFLDTYQAMPLAGYTAMFEKILDHDNISVMTGTEYSDLIGEAPKTIFTGPIDEFFDFRFGHLPYRSLTFEHVTHTCDRLLPVGVINYPSESVPFTRVTEYKHLTGQIHPKTTLCYEFANSDGDPYYPIPRAENQILYKKYEALARQRGDVTFVGRLATYKYYNMDQVVGQALATYRRIAKTATTEATAAGKR